MVDVLIVGAGPAGSAAAIRLARAGREVLLVDRCRFPRLKPCGEYYNPHCCRLFRELGVLPSILGAGARRVPELVLGMPGARALSVPVERIAPPGDEALTLGREVLDALLLDEARRAGATVREGVLVREPLLEAGSVVGALARVDGRERELRARITLAADGLRSRFARRLGLGAGDGGRRKFGLTARYAATGDASGLEMYAGAPGCCGISLRGGEANLGMVADAAYLPRIGGDPPAFFREMLRGFPELESRVRGAPRSVRTVGPLTWRTRRQAVDGCLLLGDAAGYFDPFTGEGVTFALRTAALAAETADAALAEGDVSEAGLWEYERRRGEALGPRVRLQRLVLAVTEHPALFAHVLGRLERCPEAAAELLSVVADVLPAQRLFSPRLLSRLV